MKVPVSAYFHGHLLPSVFDLAILMDMKWYVVLMCISLIISDSEHLFMCLLAIRVSSLGKCVGKSFVHF